MQQRRSIQGGAARPARAAIMPVIVSILLVIALVAANAFSGNRILQVQSLGGNAPEVYTTSESFASGANITVDDAAEAEGTFEILMGNEVAPRKQFIVEGAYRLDAEQIDA